MYSIKTPRPNYFRETSLYRKIISKGKNTMKKLLAVLCLGSVLLTATSCMRGGNVDKGDDGRIGHTEKTTESHKDKVTTDKSHKDRRIMDTVEDFGRDVERIPSRVRRGIKDAANDIGNSLNDSIR